MPINFKSFLGQKNKNCFVFVWCTKTRGDPVETKKEKQMDFIQITSIGCTDIMSTALFMLYLMYLMTKNHLLSFHLAGIVQLLHTFSLIYTIDANDNLNQNFVYFMAVLIASFFLMLCEVNFTYIFIIM